MTILIFGLTGLVIMVHTYNEPPFREPAGRMLQPGMGMREPGAMVPPPERGRKPKPVKNWPLFNFVLTSALISGLSLGLRVSEKLSLNEKLRKEAEKERLNQELARIRSEHTADAVMKLSDMMRYVIQDVNRDTVPPELELDYIRHFVELQKLRLNEMVTATLEIAGNPSGLDIAPIMLVPFVENVFKHGTSAHEPAAILISITLTGTTLNLVTENRVFPGRASGETFGIGLSNTRKRLELIYPDKHELVYGETNGVFHLTLNMELA